MDWLGSLSVAISVSALVIAAVTMWLTLLRKGEIKMTQPALVVFAPGKDTERSPKIFLRTLLYSTSKRGQVIESLYVHLHRGRTHQNFYIWSYGDDFHVYGSGLCVGENGVSVYHHFQPPPQAGNFSFEAGDYRLDVFARLIGRKSSVRLARISLSMTAVQAEKLKEDDVVALFIQNQDTSEYEIYIDENLLRMPRQVGVLDALFAMANKK